MLEKTGKAAVIHPTGTGKSFIAFKLIEDNPDRRFLWLSPSEYIYQTQVEAVHREAPEFSTEKVVSTPMEIPRCYVTEDGLGLGMWIQNQRRVRSGTIAGTITEAQIQRLNAIGMAWSCAD